MRRICLWLWTAAFLSAVCLPVGAVSTSASSAILMDADSGRVLYEQNADEPRLIASVTKLLTALVAVERGPDLDRVVEIKAEWLSGVEGSSIYLQAGEQISMEALLYGLLLHDFGSGLIADAVGQPAAFPTLSYLRAKLQALLTRASI